MTAAATRIVRSAATVGALCLVLATPLAAAGEDGAKTAPSAPPAGDAAAPSRPVSTAGTAAPSRSPSAAASKATATPRSGARARRLEDIPIEGDVAMPQVLFISGRDQRRIAGFQHRRFLPDARTIGERTVLPSRLALTATAPPAATGGGEAR